MGEQVGAQVSVGEQVRVRVSLGVDALLGVLLWLLL